MLGLVFIIGIIGLLFAAWMTYDVMRRDTGTPAMKKVADAIKEGAEAYIKTQYKTIAIIAAAATILIFGVYLFAGQRELAIHTGIAFIAGALFSGIAGIVGMLISVRANIRTASAARRSVMEALQVSLRGGAVAGSTIVSLSLLGIAGIYYLFGADPQHTPFLMIGYGFGASFVALFAQLGGGIYTKAADVGADLVGKIEAGIPEDDPRNPAVIADLVGDNVGDCAGRGADLFESIAAENIGAMILGVALFSTFGVNGVLFPLIMSAFGLLASMVGVLCARAKESADPMVALNRGYYVTSLLAVVGLHYATTKLLGNVWFFYAGLVGIAMSLAFLAITQYYTATKYRPVRSIAADSQTGPATNIIGGWAVGLEATALPVIAISVSLLLSYYFGARSGIEHGGLFGTAVATVGMLSTAAYVLAMDVFGPITDNAGGIVEMSNAPEAVRKRTDKLDALGNTTKALTKGYAIGSAALAAFLLFSAYLETVANLTGKAFAVVDIAKVDVFVGGLLGAMLVFLFSAFAMRAVGKTAQYIITEVRRQFKNKGIMRGTVKPDYAACVAITTKGALKNMVIPGVLAIVFPLIVGLLLRAEATAAMLMVGTIAGILMALMFNTGGGAWDNAKKYIESGVYGGKRSPAHQAAVVGDTVGDPAKDTVGPSLHVLIKLLATLTLVLAPLFI